MKIYDRDALEEYMRYDPIKHILHRATFTTTTQSWLDEPALRMIFYDVYGDLLETIGKSVLDVGGGYSYPIKFLADRHHYTPIDLFAHDSPPDDFDVNREDWFDAIPQYYDTIISNNLFPYVDQRLALFLERWLPFCREMRLSLTYYNFPKWYKTKRTDADEIMHLLQWDGNDLARVLSPYLEDAEADRLRTYNPESLFRNGRQVCFLVLKGGSL